MIKPPVLELRVALTAHDYEKILAIYQEGLGLEPAALWTNDGGHAVIFDMGKATLEIFDERQAEVIDEIEAGQRLSGQIRFAIQVANVDAAVERLVAKGAMLVHKPVTTPWGDYNARLQSPDGLQITLFQPADSKDEE